MCNSQGSWRGLIQVYTESAGPSVPILRVNKITEPQFLPKALFFQDCESGKHHSLIWVYTVSTDLSVQNP